MTTSRERLASVTATSPRGVKLAHTRVPSAAHANSSGIRIPRTPSVPAARRTEGRWGSQAAQAPSTGERFQSGLNHRLFW